MGYHVIDPAEAEPTPEFPCDRRSVDEAVGLGTLAAAVYDVAPGESLARTYHYHESREELFYVLEGTLAVETPEGTHEVGPDRIFVAEPNSPIRPHVPASADGGARVLGVGAPRHDPGRAFDPETDDTPGER